MISDLLEVFEEGITRHLRHITPEHIPSRQSLAILRFDLDLREAIGWLTQDICFGTVSVRYPRCGVRGEEWHFAIEWHCVR
jgi:hypothetical protein